LKVFRLWYMTELAACIPGEYPGLYQKNPDGGSNFSAFLLADMPDAIANRDMMGGADNA